MEGVVPIETMSIASAGKHLSNVDSLVSRLPKTMKQCRFVNGSPIKIAHLMMVIRLLERIISKLPTSEVSIF